jgi:hypothetical protein
LEIEKKINIKNTKMKNRQLKIAALFMAILCVVLSACKDEEVPPISNAMRVLTAKINQTNLKDSPKGVDQEISVEIIFSHTLNTSTFESALSFASTSGAVGTNIVYSNSNSIATITNTAELDFETEYTISVEAGAFGEAGNELAETLSWTFTVKEFVPPNVLLSTDKLSITEAGGMATITATLTEAVNQAVTINLAFAGTASGADYLASASNVVITAGQLSATMTLTAIDDMEIEGPENITVTIGNVVNAIQATPQEVSVGIEDNDAAGRGFIINEVLFDPPGGDAGDANRDGTRSASADEFIEFVNDSDTPMDLSGFTLYDATNFATRTPLHTFPANTIVAPKSVYVLFGGGTPTGDFSGATVAVSDAGNMSLNNAADVITLLDGAGNVFLTFDTANDGAGIDFGADQSVTRSPEITGSFAVHTNANANLLFSPGSRADGTPIFADGNAGLGFIVNEVLFDPASGSAGDANGDGTRSASEDEFIEFINDSSSPLDISGYTVYDTDNFATRTPRHTFSNGTIIPARGVYVLFGGGAAVGDFGNAMVGISTTGNLNLNNAADQIIVLDAASNTVLTFDTAVDGAGIDFGADQSVTRSPDVSGGFTLHQTANGALSYSPGKKVDGSNF